MMDGVWPVTLAMAIPLSAPAAKLARSRPTASVLGAQTVASFLGVLLINFLFMVGALAYLWSQDWFSCRTWGGNDVSNTVVIGDNYETQTLFLVGGYQYVHAAAAFNFGHEFRQAWYRNYVLVGLFVTFSFIMFYILFVPSELSCVYRVNCVNENVQLSVTDTKIPIQNPWNTTEMPDHFKRGIFALMVTNAALVMCYDYFVVNGIRRYYSDKKRLEAQAIEAESPGAEKTPSEDLSLT
jgi:hypothetical protein